MKKQHNTRDEWDLFLLGEEPDSPREVFGVEEKPVEKNIPAQNNFPLLLPAAAAAVLIIFFFNFSGEVRAGFHAWERAFESITFETGNAYENRLVARVPGAESFQGGVRSILADLSYFFSLA